MPEAQSALRNGVHPTHASTKTFLSNCWYAAAWSEEIGERPLGITVCGERLVLFRRDDGTVAGYSGTCPHRFASLARGTVLPGNRLQCPYHGLEFGADGRCVNNPNGPIPRSAVLKTYELRELHSIIWIWIGEPNAVDPSLIPDFSCLTDPRYHTIRGSLRTEAHFELITDNLMDLSHVAFLHQGGIGGDVTKNGKQTLLESGTTLYSNMRCENGPAPPVWAKLFNDYAGNVDHWLDMRWDAPCLMLLDVGVTPAGRPRSEGITVLGTHILTPETETSTRYLWAATRDFARDNDKLDTEITASLEYAFVHEDKPMIQEIQGNMEGRGFDEMRPVILSSDIGGVRARRLLQELRIGRKTLLPSRKMPPSQ